MELTLEKKAEVPKDNNSQESLSFIESFFDSKFRELREDFRSILMLK